MKIEIPNDLHRKLRIEAAKSGQFLGVFVAELIKQALAARTAPKKEVAP